MNYEVEGKGEALVFVHGLSNNLLYWEFLANNLKKGFKVIRIDLRGHGESQLGNDKITMDLYADDLNDLLDELNIKKVNLIGFSLGGAVALDFTIKFPKKVSSLVLMSSFARCDSNLADVLNQFKITLNNGFEDFFDYILPKILCPQVIDENSQELEMLKEMSLQNANVEAYIKATDACLDFDVESRLSQICIPTLVLAGRYDEIVLMNYQKSLHNDIKDSKLIVFDNVKHNLLVGKNNAKILSILKNFYKKREDK